MSSLRSSGRASCVPLANRPSFPPLLAHHAHDHVVHVTAGETYVLAVTGRRIDVEEAAMPDGRPVDLYHEVGIVAGTLALLPFEPGAYPFEGNGQWWIAASGELDLQVVPEPPEGLLVLLLYGPQRNFFSPEHQP